MFLMCVATLIETCDDKCGNGHMPILHITPGTTCYSPQFSQIRSLSRHASGEGIHGIFKGSTLTSSYSPSGHIAMFPSKVLLLHVLISLASVDASPLSRSTGKGTLSFATRTNKSGALNIAEKDRARAQALKDTAHLSKRAVVSSINATNAGVLYTAQVGFGSPPTYCT